MPLAVLAQSHFYVVTFIFSLLTCNFCPPVVLEYINPFLLYGANNFLSKVKEQRIRHWIQWYSLQASAQPPEIKLFQ